MTRKIDGKIYFATNEVLEKTGIKRNTLFYWLREKKIDIPNRKDRSGRRLWTQEDVDKIVAYDNAIFKQ